MRIFKQVALISLFLIPQIVAIAAPSIGLGYTPKYPANFKHFDYVNPNAPKGGKIILPGFGNFDSFNPYILKGVAVDGLGDLIFETLMVQSTDEPYSLYGHIGVATLKTEVNTSLSKKSGDVLIGQADRVLYDAKANGRNRVTCAPESCLLGDEIKPA